VDYQRLTMTWNVKWENGRKCPDQNLPDKKIRCHKTCFFFLRIGMACRRNLFPGLFVYRIWPIAVVNPSDFEDRPENRTGPGWGSGCWSHLIYYPNIPIIYGDIRNKHHILGIYIYYIQKYDPHIMMFIPYIPIYIWST
jgi:hypothetical protein